MAHRQSTGALSPQVFISDIRACQNKEQEQKRVDKELAKIRARFGEDKPLSSECGGMPPARRDAGAARA